MFLKQTAFKPRSNSGSSDGGSGSAIDTSSNATPDTANVSAAASRRRSSATEKFAGLQQVKRGSNTDTNIAGRKASFAEQKPGSTGVLGSMWNQFTKGT